jgi:prepilin-type N-terminal cleavage/methylation domain-containing protein
VHRSPDRGLSLIELLVAVMLIGLVVVGILVSLRTTTAATGIDRDHAISYSWLQAASDEIYRDPRIPCTSGQAAAIAAYTAAAHRAPIPVTWRSEGDPSVPQGSAAIRVTNVEYLGRTNPDAVFEWDKSFCFEGGVYVESPLYTQRVTIESTSPDGRIVKTLQMVKNEG